MIVTVWLQYYKTQKTTTTRMQQQQQQCSITKPELSSTAFSMTSKASTESAGNE
jgi:hypothetical protein